MNTHFSSNTQKCNEMCINDQVLESWSLLIMFSVHNQRFLVWTAYLLESDMTLSEHDLCGLSGNLILASWKELWNERGNQFWILSMAFSHHCWRWPDSDVFLIRNTLGVLILLCRGQSAISTVHISSPFYNYTTLAYSSIIIIIIITGS